MIVLVVLCLGAAQRLSAQPNNNQPRPGRFLFLVEKSEAAGRIDEAVRQTVFDLIYKGANGNMAFGSFFEIWTFNDTVTTRGFEAAQLLYETRLDVATKATLFLRALPNQGEANMTELTEVLRRVAAGNDQLTVFLITEGGVPISGTPVDQQLNDIYGVHYPNMRQSASPFITTLRLRDGGIAAYAVSADVATLAMPPMPERLPVASRPATPPPRRETPAAPTRREPVESIIITGETRAAAATNRPSPSADVAVQSTEALPEREEIDSTGSDALPTPSVAADPDRVEPLTTNDETVADVSPATEPIPAPQEAAPRQPVARAEPEPRVVTAAPEIETPAETVPANVPRNEPKSPVVAVEETATTPSNVAGATGTQLVEKPQPAEPVATPPPVVPSESATAATSRPTEPVPSTSPAPRTEEPTTQPAATNPPATVEPVTPESAAPPVEPAPAVESDREGDGGVVAVTGLEWLRSGGLFVAGTIFLLLAFFFAWMLYRRTRRLAEASLISKTYGRERERR